jgi:hypothetical protein
MGKRTGQKKNNGTPITKPIATAIIPMPEPARFLPLLVLSYAGRAIAAGSDLGASTLGNSATARLAFKVDPQNLHLMAAALIVSAQKGHVFVLFWFSCFPLDTISFAVGLAL